MEQYTPYLIETVVLPIERVVLPIERVALLAFFGSCSLFPTNTNLPVKIRIRRTMSFAGFMFGQDF